MSGAAFEWDGECFRPLPHFRARLDKELVVHQVYRLEPIEERSHKQHGFFFACVTTVWKTLPEGIAERYPSADRLRKRALIRRGHCRHTDYVLDTPADAIKFAAILQSRDEDAVIEVSGRVVREFIAKSQSYRSMGKDEFKKSCDDVLDELAKLTGTDVTTIQSNTPPVREYHPQDQV